MSAWENLRRLDREYGSDAVTSVLYGWYVTFYTISAETAGRTKLYTFEESDAMIMKMAEHLLKEKGNGQHWRDWRNFRDIQLKLEKK